MIVLSWISFFFLVMALGVYIVWSMRESAVPAPWLRTSFFAGSLVFLALFIVFTVHTMRVIPRTTHAENLTPAVAAGKAAWQKHLCIDCHTILGNGAYYGPDLTQAWPRFLESAGGDRDAARVAMIAFLRNPPPPSRWRRGMPAVTSEADAAALADFLAWTSAIETNRWPPAPIRKAVAQKPAVQATSGMQAFASAGCTACHSIGGGAIVGPDLAGVANRYTRDELAMWIRNPESFYGTRGGPRNEGFPAMPALQLDDRQIQQIVDYLEGTKGAS